MAGSHGSLVNRIEGFHRADYDLVLKRVRMIQWALETKKVQMTGIEEKGLSSLDIRPGPEIRENKNNFLEDHDTLPAETLQDLQVEGGLDFLDLPLNTAIIK